MRSIVEALGTPQFVRVKVGIGRPPHCRDAADYVLEPVTRDEMDVLDPCVNRAVEALEVVLRRGVEAAMNQFNVREPDPDES